MPDEEDPHDVLARNKTFKKVSLVLLPVCFLAGCLNYLDRTNLTFAALELNADLGFGPLEYGIGAGAFYLGYGLAHIPSAFMTMQLGARWWYGGMTIAWGIVGTCAAAIQTRAGLAVQRFFLGVTEAGAVPSAIHLLCQFYPKHMSTKPFTAVTLANVVSVMFAAPLAAGIMRIETAGLKGWQWLFILEGIPSVMLGIVMLIIVPDGPLTAWFLKPEERVALHKVVHGSGANAASNKVTWSQLPGLVIEACKLPLLWYLATAGLSWVLCVFSLNSWISIITKNMLAGTVLTNSTSTGGASATNTLHATLLSAIPYFCAAVGMWAVASSSHHFKEKEFHIGMPWVIGGISLTFFAPLYKASFAAGFGVIVIALTLAYSSQSVTFARVTESLDAKHAGVGVSIFNAVGAAIGGFLGPFVVGAFVQRTGTFVSSMVAMGAFLCWAGVMMVGLGIYTRISKRRASRRRQEPSDNRIDSDVVASTSELLAARKVIASDIDNDNRALSDVELAVRPNPRPQSVFEA